MLVVFVFTYFIISRNKENIGHLRIKDAILTMQKLIDDIGILKMRTRIIVCNLSLRRHWLPLIVK